MKNNIISIVKSKKFIIISASIIAALLFIAVIRFLGLQYYMFYLMHDFDEVLEALLKISLFAVMIMFAIVLFKKIDNKESKSNEGESNNEKKELIVAKKNNNKSVKSLIIVMAVITVLALTALFIFSSRFFGMYYILDNLDDIIESIFQLAVIAAIIGFGAVFAKKVLEKL